LGKVSLASIFRPQLCRYCKLSRRISLLNQINVAIVVRQFLVI